MMRDLLARMRGLRFHNAIRWPAVQHLYEGRSQAWVTVIVWALSACVSIREAIEVARSPRHVFRLNTAHETKV